MNVENRWNVNSWNALRGLPWDVTERGADAAEAFHAPRGCHVVAMSRGVIQRCQVHLLRFKEARADVPVVSSAAVSVAVEHMVQTSVSVSSDVGIQLASSGTVGSLLFNESKARDFEKVTDLVLA